MKNNSIFSGVMTPHPDPPEKKWVAPDPLPLIGGLFFFAHHLAILVLAVLANISLTFFVFASCIAITLTLLAGGVLFLLCLGSHYIIVVLVSLYSLYTEKTISIFQA